ncbi:MAG: hypothetical protein GX221_10185 [Candidatus Riflebacteria bacterium]|nr:hypothetical protein [Candidatus Riflebacteria bacterium]
MSDRAIYEEFLDSEDPKTSMLAFLGLKKLFSSAPALEKTWRELFAETADILARIASTANLTLRISALKALAFAPVEPPATFAERILSSARTFSSDPSSAEEAEVYASVSSGKRRFSLPDGFALILSMLPLKSERTALLRNELSQDSTDRILPALIALQLNPDETLTDQLVYLCRHENWKIASEAMRAAVNCAGSKVELLMLSLYKDELDLAKKAEMLPVLAESGREEVNGIIKEAALSEYPLLAISGLKCLYSSSLSNKEKAEVFLAAMDNDRPEISAVGAVFAHKLGVPEALLKLSSLLSSSSSEERLLAAAAMGKAGGRKVLSLLLEQAENELDKDVDREIWISIRGIVKKEEDKNKTAELLLPKLKRMLEIKDSSKRNLAAMIAGDLGKPAREILLLSLAMEKDFVVLASLISALARTGFDSLLVYSSFRNHPDARVRANMLEAMILCGNSASPYFAEALKDPAPRVRAAGAKNLFMTGQLEVVAIINRMLLAQDAVSVLAGCYAAGSLFRTPPPLFSEEAPLPVALLRRSRNAVKKRLKKAPSHFASPEIPEVFIAISEAKGDLNRINKIMEEKSKRFPASRTIQRIRASFYDAAGEYEEAHAILNPLVGENSAILADLLDLYRLSIKLGLFEETKEIGKRAKALYKDLHDECLRISSSLRGSGADVMLQRLLRLDEPSMNLYNAMMQLKAAENDRETIADLLAEVFLARPYNKTIAKKMAALLPSEAEELKTAMQKYAFSL